MTNANLIPDLLEHQMLLLPEKTGVVFNNTSYSYRVINSEASRVASWLQSIGIHPGDRVALSGTNHIRLISGLFGILKAGAVCVPIHPNTPAANFEFVIGHSSPKVLIVDQDVLRHQENTFRRHPLLAILATDWVHSTQLPPSVVTWEQAMMYPEFTLSVSESSESLAAIIYTSGSTKNPRGVMLGHQQVTFATRAINSVLANTSNDVILMGLPMSFDYGLYQIFLAFASGAVLVLEPQFSVPMAIPRIIRRHSVTGFPGVPSLFAMLLRSRLLERTELPSLRYITSTGDVFPPAYVRRLQDLLPGVSVIPMYGLTECKRVSIMPYGCLEGRETSVGRPLPGTTVSIVDDSNCEVPPGTIGELVVRGPHVMMGYWHDPEETARRFRHDPVTCETELHTGDYFRVDDEGFLYFVGRGEIFIKSLGQKISPLEIESVVLEIEGVIEVAAVGVPDPVRGEAVHLFISLMNGIDVSTQRISEYCQKRLIPAAVPSRITILKSLPKNSNQKIDRLQLRALTLEEVRTDMSIDTQGRDS